MVAMAFGSGPTRRPELSFQVRAHVLGSLGQYRLKERTLFAELRALLARAPDLEGKRNTYVHSGCTQVRSGPGGFAITSPDRRLKALIVLR